MFDLSSHIEYLLMSHDCVVAPGLGAFLAHETPAHYDAESGQFIPPTRSLGFNQALTINDGLLTESVARRCSLTLDAARAEVDAAISSFRCQLDSSGTLPLGNLGELSISGNTIVFEPSASSAVGFRYAGLAPVVISPLAEEPQDETITAPALEPKTISIPTTLKVAASMIVLIVACGLFLTTGNLLGNRQTNFAALDSGLSRNNTTIENSLPIKAEETILISREIELNIAVPAKENSPPTIAVKPVKSPGQYLLVVGSFPSMKSALKHIGDDASLAVIEMDDKFRVYAASASSINDARDMADSLREKYPSVWICRR